MIENIALILLLLVLTTLFVFIATILFILAIPVILVWLLLAVVILGTTLKASAPQWGAFFVITSKWRACFRASVVINSL